MPKPPADPIADANREFWRMVKADAFYARWMRQRTRDLIEICEVPSRTMELRKLLERLERVSDGNQQ